MEVGYSPQLSVRATMPPASSALHALRRLSQRQRAGLTLALLLCVLLLLPASFWHFTPRDAARRLLSYWGLGWCEPYAPPYVEHHFAPSEGPGLRWEGDAQFWRLFPCARGSYRVVLPEAAAAGAGGAGAGGDTPAPPDTCASTLVTGMFDIGREHWVTYARSNAEYLSKSKLVLSLPNRMVIFTQPELVDAFVSERRRLGLMDRTFVVGMSVYCVPYAWLLEPVTRLMCAPEFSSGAAFLEVPERQQPFYNLLMYAKTLFLQAAASLPQAAINGSYYTWLDLGCHEPMCEARMAGACLDPSPWAREDRIRIALTAPMGPSAWVQGDAAWAKSHHAHHAGTIFGTSKRAAAALGDTFADALHLLMAQGMLCNDQTVFTLAYRRWPERFDLVPVLFDNWNEIVRYFARQVLAPRTLPMEWHTRQGGSGGGAEAGPAGQSPRLVDSVGR